MLLKLFRARYPQGSLSSELLQFEQGKYVVRVTIHIEGAVSGTGLGAADTIEEAEDRARERALALLNLEEIASLPEVRAIDRYSSHLSAQAPTVALPFSRGEEAIGMDGSAKQELPSSSFDEESNLSSVPLSPAIAASKEAVVESVEEKELPAPDLNFSPPSESLLRDPIPEPPVSSPLETAALPVRETPPSPSKVSRESIDFSEVLAQTNIEIRRLQWTQNQGREFLLERYGKRSRQVLTDEELLDFLEYLQSQ